MLPCELPQQEREITILPAKPSGRPARAVRRAHKDFEALLAKYPDAPGVHFIWFFFSTGRVSDKVFRVEEKSRSLRITCLPAHNSPLNISGVGAGERPLSRGSGVWLLDSVVAHSAPDESRSRPGTPARHRRARVGRKLSPDSPSRASLWRRLCRAGAEDAARERRNFSG
jgi:hypothetical protein